MCLIPKSKKLTAKKDIVCWKILNKNFTPWYFFKEKAYKLNELRVTKLRIHEGCYLDPEITIEDGFHAFTDKRKTIRFSQTCLDVNRVCEFIIPAGSKYYIGKHDDIVSNKIIFKKCLGTSRTIYNTEALDKHKWDDLDRMTIFYSNQMKKLRRLP